MSILTLTLLYAMPYRVSLSFFPKFCAKVLYFEPTTLIKLGYATIFTKSKYNNNIEMTFIRDFKNRDFVIMCSWFYYLFSYLAIQIIY